MRYTKLSEHKLNKGVFVTPFHSILSMHELEDEKSWAYGRMPEYLWIGLILKYYGREEGFKKLNIIISKLHNLAPELSTARLSHILKLDSDIQKEFYKSIVQIGAGEALAPLTIYLTTSKAPIFAEFFYSREQSIEYRCKKIVQTMNDIMYHQSNEATDIRFIALYLYLVSGKLHIQKNQADLLSAYPKTKHEDEIMHRARPLVRAMEITVLTFEETETEYLKGFWKCVSEMTDCNIYIIDIPKENRNVTQYMESLYKVQSYLSDLFVVSEPLNEKMNVLIGLFTYSYKIMKEVYEYQLFNAISGRSCVRTLIEVYIMMKYLVKNESNHDNIWRGYQLYGIGAYKKVLTKYRDDGNSEETQFNPKYIEILVNEFKDEEFIDIDTRYFDKKNIREKAEKVDEKGLYGLYYDYDSSFEHGLWGAVRESSLLKCDNPAHRYHCVPDTEDKITLQSVLPDCIMVMKKTVSFLNDIYGIPEQLMNEVINFELKFDDEQNSPDTK